MADLSAASLKSFDEIIDVEGKAVLPGLIDSHVHVLDRLAGEDSNFDLQPWLEAGVTTLIDTASQLEALDHPRPRAPRVLATGPILTAPDGYPFVGWENAPGWPVTTFNEAEEAIEQLASHGVDQIKIAIEAGFTQELSDHDAWPVLSNESMRRIVSSARSHGLRVGAHLTQASELRAALEAGVSQALHVPLSDLDEHLVSLAVQRGFSFVSTSRMWEKAPQVFEAVCRNIERIVAARGRVSAGTDAPTFYSERGLFSELRRLTECGLDPPRALFAATTWAGELLTPRWDLGTLEPGQLADLMVVDGRPWVAIEDLASLELVLVEGQVVFRREVSELEDTLEEH